MLDHLQATLDDLENLNAFVFPQSLRTFQQVLAETGGFSLRSPFDGCPIRTSEHWVLPFADHLDQLALPFHLYRFEDQAPVWLASFHIGAGYPICAMYVEGVYAQIVSHAPSISGSDRNFRTLRRLLSKLDKLPALTPVKHDNDTPNIIVGHPNFAHHMWNELPALLALRKMLKNDLSVRALFSPLGPLGAVKTRYSLKSTRTSGRNLPTPVGSTYINTESAAWLNSQLPAHRPSKPPTKPVIWIAHRTDGRSCLNFGDFLGQFDRLCRTRFTPSYIIDSFSYPADFSESQYDPIRANFEQREKQSETLFETLRQRIAPAGRRHVCSSSGLPVHKAIALAHQADFYISPIGSIHHKVAWLQSIDGIIHGPAKACNEHVARWHAMQSEIACEPSFIPPELMEDVKPSGSHLFGPRNMDYRMTDPDQAADIAFQALVESWERRHPTESN